MKRIVRQRIDSEMHFRAGRHFGDVGLIDRCPDLHAAQIAGDQKQTWRVEARDDRLADVDATIDDRAVDRRDDRGVIQVCFGELEGCRLLQDGRLGRFEVGFGTLRRWLGRGRSRRRKCL